jgi:ABC-type sugar transport system permease subunit
MKSRVEGYLYVLPCLLVLAVVLGFPILFVIWMGFNQVSLTLGFTWRGLANYARVLQQRDFLVALGNTMYFSVASVAFHLLIGIVLALLLNRRFRGRRLVRTVVLIPWMLAYVVGALTWRWIANSSYGILNEVLVRLGLIKEYVPWLGKASTAMPTVIVAHIWKQSPFIMLMLLAGIQAVPAEQYEAAHLDGANAWSSFWHITVPNLRRVILITATLDFIWSFKSFDLIYVMTGGGPGISTEVLSTTIYKTFFSAMQFGQGASMAVLLTIVVLALSYLYVLLMGKSKVSDEVY